MIVPYEDLPVLREEYGRATMVYAHGVYDVLHSAHARHLRVAQEIGQVVVVGIWSDECTAYRKGPSRPVNDIAERLCMIDALKPVDYAFEIPGIGGPDELGIAVANWLRPDVYLTSSRKHQMFGGAAYIEHPDGRSTSIVYDLGYVHDRTSSTQTIDKAALAGVEVGNRKGLV